MQFCVEDFNGHKFYSFIHKNRTEKDTDASWQL